MKFIIYLALAVSKKAKEERQGIQATVEKIGFWNKADLDLSLISTTRCH